MSHLCLQRHHKGLGKFSSQGAEVFLSGGTRSKSRIDVVFNPIGLRAQVQSSDRQHAAA